MDPTTLIPLLGAVVGIFGTIAGISVKARYDNRLEKARVVREETAAKKAEAAQAQERVEDQARGIADLFLDELQVVRRFREEHEPQGFPIWYEARWRAEGDIPFRRAVAAVRDQDARNQLVEIVDSLDDFQSIAQWRYFWSKEQRWVEDTLTLGFDLASSMARGQEMDPTLLKRWIDFRKVVNGYYDYLEEQRQAEEDARRASREKEIAEAEQAREKAEAKSKAKPKPKPRVPKPRPTPKS